MAAELRWSPEWPSFAGADWAERILNESVTDRLHEKQGRAIARWTLSDGNGNELVVFLKRHVGVLERSIIHLSMRVK